MVNNLCVCVVSKDMHGSWFHGAWTRTWLEDAKVSNLLREGRRERNRETRKALVFLLPPI